MAERMMMESFIVVLWMRFETLVVVEACVRRECLCCFDVLGCEERDTLYGGEVGSKVPCGSPW